MDTFEKELIERINLWEDNRRRCSAIVSCPKNCNCRELEFFVAGVVALHKKHSAKVPSREQVAEIVRKWTHPHPEGKDARILIGMAPDRMVDDLLALFQEPEKKEWFPVPECNATIHVKCDQMVSNLEHYCAMCGTKRP